MRPNAFDGTFAVRSIDGDDIHKAHSITQNRRLEQFLLADQTHAPPGKGKQGRGVEVGPVIRDEDIRLFRIQQLESFDVDFHAAQPQPGARPKIGPWINPVRLVCQTGDQQNRRREY